MTLEYPGTGAERSKSTGFERLTDQMDGVEMKFLNDRSLFAGNGDGDISQIREWALEASEGHNLEVAFPGLLRRQQNVATGARRRQSDEHVIFTPERLNLAAE